MKANRKFVSEDEAVSPVIAVILMVAITVVLAATVFVLVSDIGNQSNTSQPPVSWGMDEVQDRWSVSQAPNQVSWASYSMRSATGNLYVALNVAASTTVTGTSGSILVDSDGVELNTVSFENKNLGAGDYLEFCISGAPVGGVTNVEITLNHIASNSIANQKTFANIAAC